MTTHRNCEGITRRDCIKLGLGGLLAGGLVGALRGTAAAAVSPTRQAKACILIWMDGGPSHYETFDPKPDAPIEFRGQFDAIPTKVAGVRYSQHMKRLASIADRTADPGSDSAAQTYPKTPTAPASSTADSPATRPASR